MKNLIIVALLLSITQLGFSQNKVTNSQTKVAYAYLQLKDQLIVSDSIAAKSSGAELSKLLKGFSVKNKFADSLAKLNSNKARVIQNALALSKTGNINLQRKYFEIVSNEIWPLLNHETKGSTLYLQQCPMTGVKWLSLSEEIKNPYYPKNMLGCGTVIATSN